VEAQAVEIQELGLKGGNFFAPDTNQAPQPGRLISFQQLSRLRTSPIPVEAMMPVVAPVVVMPWAIAADLARSVIRPDHPAIAMRVIVIGRRIIEVTVKMVPVKVVSEREAAVAKAAAVENMTAAKSAAMERCAAASETAAVKGSTTTMKAAATVETASTMMAATAMAATVTATAMTAADFARQPIRDMLRCRRRAWIDQR
jgi:hypothetical protein